MTLPPTRRRPLVELDPATIEAMIAPVSAGRAVRETHEAGGMTNSTYRVTLEDGAVYGLRIQSGGPAALDAECRLLRFLSGAFPTPDVLFADAEGAHAYRIFTWADGITLAEFQRGTDADTFLTLAEPLGRLLGGLAGALSGGDAPGLSLPEDRAGPLLARAEERLRAGPARERLGTALADGLRARLAEGTARLEALDAAGLVHADFAGHNVLVRSSGDGGWEVSGVIDWESARLGSMLWDLGSLFRYPGRYAPAFRAAFERGYRAMRELPDDWWPMARLLDSTRVVSLLSEPRDVPAHATGRQLVEILLGGDEALAALRRSLS